MPDTVPDEGPHDIRRDVERRVRRLDWRAGRDGERRFPHTAMYHASGDALADCVLDCRCREYALIAGLRIDDNPQVIGARFDYAPVCEMQLVCLDIAFRVDSSYFREMPVAGIDLVPDFDIAVRYPSMLGEYRHVEGEKLARAVGRVDDASRGAAVGDRVDILNDCVRFGEAPDLDVLDPLAWGHAAGECIEYRIPVAFPDFCHIPRYLTSYRLSCTFSI